MSAAEIPGKRAVSRFDLARDLRAAELDQGAVLVVHSSLAQVGWVLGGPAEMVRALQDVVGPTGTVLMPTFSFNLASWSLPPFDPRHTPSRVGRLTEIFWRMEDVLRSPHPTHSIAAWGALACDMVGGPVDYEPLGVNSPLDRARLAGARILMIGVGQNRNSTVHLAESLAGMPYLAIPFAENVPYETAFSIPAPGAPPTEVRLNEVPGSSEGFEVLDHLLLEKGVAETCLVGDAESTLMTSRDLCETVVALLRADPLLLLRGAKPSEINRRRLAYMLKKTNGGLILG